MNVLDGRTSLLVVQPTPFCNIDCAYCYLPHRTSRNRLKLHEAGAMFRRLLAFPTIRDSITIVWHAGEPLVLPVAYYEELFRIVRDVAPPGLMVRHSFQTNATLITPEWCDFIKAWSVNVGVSVDGPQEFHDRHRKTRDGRGTFDRTLRGLRTLQAHGVPFHVITVLTADSLEQPEAMFGFYRAHGIEFICFNIEEQEGSNVAGLPSRGVDPALYGTFLRRFLDLCIQSGHPLRIREVEETVLRLRSSAAKPGNDWGNPQTVPFGIVSVDCEGAVSTFSPELLGLTHARYGAFTFGNLRDDDFPTIAARIAASALDADVKEGIVRCRAECDFFDLCGGGAPSNKIYENGTAASTKTFYCRSQQAGIEAVLDLIEALPPYPLQMDEEKQFVGSVGHIAVPVGV